MLTEEARRPRDLRTSQNPPYRDCKREPCTQTGAGQGPLSAALGRSEGGRDQRTYLWAGDLGIEGSQGPVAWTLPVQAAKGTWGRRAVTQSSKQRFERLRSLPDGWFSETRGQRPGLCDGSGVPT